MQAVVSNLMASLLLIQAVTGWCWHAPDGCAKCHGSTAQSVAAASCCQDHHCKPSGPQEKPLDPCRGQDECHGFCTFVAPQETRLDTAQAVFSFDVALIVLTEADHLFLSAISWERASFFAASEPPLRLHLLHQLLLI